MRPFLKRLETIEAKYFESLKDPDFQYVLVEAQKEYCRSGQKELLNLLNDLLIQRVQAKTQELYQIVLNESISVVPKLLPEHFDILSLVFIIKHSHDDRVGDFKALESWFEKDIFPFASEFPDLFSHYQHLAYAKCVTMGHKEHSLEDCLLSSYPTIFTHGFTKEYFIKIVGDWDRYKSNLICLDSATDTWGFRWGLDILRQNRSKFEIEKIELLINSTKMSTHAIGSHLQEKHPSIHEFLLKWNSSQHRLLELTSVGMMIANSNMRRRGVNNYPIQNWFIEPKIYNTRPPHRNFENKGN